MDRLMDRVPGGLTDSGQIVDRFIDGLSDGFMIDLLMDWLVGG